MALLAGCLMVSIVFELGARYGFARVSRTQRGILQERAAFLHTQGAGTAVFIGNSLLKESVDLDLLNELSKNGGAARFTYSRFAIEQTEFIDWYYGLRNFFAHGARPQRLIVMLDSTHWSSTSARGEYFAHELMQLRDVGRVGSELGLNRTAFTDYTFANLSAWLGSRSEIRKWVLNMAVPPVLPFLEALGNRHVAVGDDLLFRRIAPRMQAMRALCDQYGVKLAIIIPPASDPQQPYRPILESAALARVPFMMPVAPGTYGRELFQHDRYHLNTEGAQRFTRALADSLKGLQEGENVALVRGF